MAAELRVELDDLVRRLGAVDARVRDAVLVAARAVAIELERDVQVKRLRANPPYLKVVSGRLTSSTRGTAERRAQGAVAAIGTNVVYARPHEFGFSGTVTVPAHSRLGRPVRTHTRFMRLRERRMFRDAVDAVAPRAGPYLLAALGHLVETGTVPSLGDLASRVGR